MSKKEKRLLKIKNNPKGISFEEIDTLLTSFGFEARNTGGSHYVYTHQSLNSVQDYVTIPRHRPVKPIYIRKAIAAIEKLIG